MLDLEKRIQILEDTEAIKKLKSQYAAACDQHYDIEKLAGLFTEDAVFDTGGMYGVLEGKQKVLELFKNVSQPNWTLSVHYFIQPDITVEGDHATCRWQLWQPCTLKGTGPTWLSGIEDDEYTKIEGKWFISRIKLTVYFHTTYAEGWEKKRTLD